MALLPGLLLTGKTMTAAMVQLWWKDWRALAGLAANHPLPRRATGRRPLGTARALTKDYTVALGKRALSGRTPRKARSGGMACHVAEGGAQAHLRQRLDTPARGTIHRIGAGGRTETNQAAIHEALWKSRGGVWKRPAAPAAGQGRDRGAWTAEPPPPPHFLSRALDSALQPRLSLNRLTGLLLAPSGSAAGLNGVPCRP